MNEFDKLADAVDTPMITELQREYNRSIDDGYSLQRMNENDDIRFARWNAQSSDGKKHSQNMGQGKQAFPFEGANDGRRVVVHALSRLHRLEQKRTSFQQRCHFFRQRKGR